MQVLKGIQRFPFSKKKKKIRGFLWKYPEVVLAIHYFQCYYLANKDLEFYKKSKLEKKHTAGPLMMQFLGLGKIALTEYYLSANYTLNAKFALSEFLPRKICIK